MVILGKLFYELEAIPIKIINDNEYKSQLAKFYYSQPINKVYRDIMKFDIDTLTSSQKDIFVDMAFRTFTLGPDKRDINELLHKISGKQERS